VERYADELEAVMDAAGSERAVLFAALDAGAMGIVFATTRPARVAGSIWLTRPPSTSGASTTRVRPSK
jgi:pimeloyl-ACP methyl ester carboxylesterase